MSSCELINLGLQKWQINFVLMAASSSGVHFSFHCAGTEVGGVLRGPRTCIAMTAFWATWLPIWSQLGINTVQMKLIDFRCQGLYHSTWKIHILRKMFFWQQMILCHFAFYSPIPLWFAGDGWARPCVCPGLSPAMLVTECHVPHTLLSQQLQLPMRISVPPTLSSVHFI